MSIWRIEHSRDGGRTWRENPEWQSLDRKTTEEALSILRDLSPEQLHRGVHVGGTPDAPEGALSLVDESAGRLSESVGGELSDASSPA